MNKWIIFSKERFPFLSHLLMISLFVGAHFILAKDSFPKIGLVDFVIIFFSISIFFFKMRLYDEIKDYELDCKINKDRPLPRGLLKLKEVNVAIVICIVLELFLFSFLGLQAFVTIFLTICYSLLMYKEFFIGKLIRPHLTTYAVVHTIVTLPMGLSIFSGLFKVFPWQLGQKYLLFSLCSWFVFNIFEFGRKTFSDKEERGEVESYSKIFGRYGSVFLVFIMSLISVLLVSYIEEGISLVQLLFSFSIVVVGILYAYKNTKYFARIYRSFSSLYIIVFYIVFIIEIKFGKIL